MGPDTVFLPVLEESLMFTRHLSGERNVGELLVVKTVRYDQVVPIANLTHLSIPVRVRGTGKPRGPDAAGGGIGNNVQPPPRYRVQGDECVRVRNANRQDFQRDDPNAEVLIQIKWPDNHPDDVDLWVEDPNGEVVWYKSLRSGLMKLDRDDRGNWGEYCVEVDGTWIRNPLNQETVSVRGIVPGEFVVNIHHYNATGNEDVPVEVKVEDLNPVATPVFYTTLHLDHKGQELTAVRFKMNEEGRILDVVTDQPKALVKRYTDRVCAARNYRNC